MYICIYFIKKVAMFYQESDQLAGIIYGKNLKNPVALVMGQLFFLS